MSVLKHGGGFILLTVSYDSCLTDVSPGLYTFGFWLECMLYVYPQLGRERGGEVILTRSPTTFMLVIGSEYVTDITMKRFISFFLSVFIGLIVIGKR